MTDILQCPACGHIGLDQALSVEWWDCLGSENGAFCPECDADVSPFVLRMVNGTLVRKQRGHDGCVKHECPPPQVMQGELF